MGDDTTTTIPGAARALLDKGEKEHLRALAERMQQAGYDEASLRRLLGTDEFCRVREGVKGSALRRAGEDTPLAHLGAFWFLGHAREAGLLEGLLGNETLQVLRKLHLVEDGPRGVTARAHLFPCMGRLIFTDLSAHAGDALQQVYWLGIDSLSLARSAPRTPVGRALDLCTGSGVQAIMNGAHASESWGVDINPRALEYCRINAILNGLESVSRFVQGSLYDPLPEGRFGLITANPPFVPTPRGDLALFRPGGETGEEITAGIVAGLAERLDVGGTLALVSQVPVMRNCHALDRVEQWLGGAAGWGLAYVTMSPMDRENMIAGHVPSRSHFVVRLGLKEGDEAYRREFDSWLDCYERNGIVGVELAMTYVRRLEAGHGGWRAKWNTPCPAGSISSWVETWLDAQDRFSPWHEGWEWRPAPRNVRRLLVDARNSEGFVFHAPTWCPAGLHLEAESAFLLAQVDGRKTAAELREAFASHYSRSPEEAGPEVARRLGMLGRQLLLS